MEEEEISYDDYADFAWWEFKKLCESYSKYHLISKETFIKEFAIWQWKFKTVIHLEEFERVADEIA